MSDAGQPSGERMFPSVIVIDVTLDVEQMELLPLLL